MANDINSVYIQVIADTGEVQRNLTKAEKAFLGLNKTTKKTGGLSKSIARDMTKMAAGIFAVDRAMSAAASAARRMVQDVSDFQRMSVELRVATGSAVQAEQAFEMLQATARKLPTSLKDLTTGFVRLKNMGLDASENSLISFSNTAAAMGKTLKQFVEAVADANTREFERLKEFGILARNQGDKIRFVFRGITTEVDNSSRDIVKFLTDIGNTEFAGAATEQIDTLAARFTKLQDAIFNLNIAFGEGAAGTLGDFLKFLTEKADATVLNKSIDDLNDKMREGAIEANAFQKVMMRVLDPTGRGFEGAVKGADDLREVFTDLTSKEFVAADKLIKEQAEKVWKLAEAGKANWKIEREKLGVMVAGLAAAKAQLANDEKRAARGDLIQRARQRHARINIQQAILEEAAAERLFEKSVKQADTDGNILKLKELKAEAEKKAAEIGERVAAAKKSEELSESQLTVLSRQHGQALDTVDGIQASIAGATKEEADRRREILSTLKEDRNARMSSLREQMASAMEVGNAADYNAERERQRQLATKLATSEGVELTEALTEAYNNAAYEVEVLKSTIKDGSLGADDLKAANDSLDEYTAEMVRTQAAIDGVAEKTKEAGNEMKEMFDDVREGIADAVVEGENFKGVLASVLKQIAKTNLLKAIGGFGSDGKAGSGILGLASGLFRAKGGPVTANRSYVVGERGPELFTPSGSGSITPNNRMGGGRSGEVNVTNNFSISGGVDQQTQQMIAQSVSTSVQLAVAKVEDNKRRRIS